MSDVKREAKRREIIANLENVEKKKVKALEDDGQATLMINE